MEKTRDPLSVIADAWAGLGKSAAWASIGAIGAETVGYGAIVGGIGAAITLSFVPVLGVATVIAIVETNNGNTDLANSAGQVGDIVQNFGSLGQQATLPFSVLADPSHPYDLSNVAGPILDFGLGISDPSANARAIAVMQGLSEGDEFSEKLRKLYENWQPSGSQTAPDGNSTNSPSAFSDSTNASQADLFGPSGGMCTPPGAGELNTSSGSEFLNNLPQEPSRPENQSTDDPGRESVLLPPMSDLDSDRENRQEQLEEWREERRMDWEDMEEA